MARKINRLSVKGIAAIKKPGRYADGEGLYLLVKPDGRRTWLFRYRDRTTGKLRDKGLGPLADVTLERARADARAARLTLRDGVDPIDSTRTARTEAALERAKAKTFGDCATAYITAHRKSWRNAKHGGQWRSTLDTYAAALLPLPVAAVDTAAVVKALEPIWADKTETATRTRQRIEAVLDWATARGFRTGENPARWRGHLQKLLPAPAKLKAVKPRAALPYTEMHAFMERLRVLPGLSARALALQLLTATRPGEATAARWEEFDLAKALWTIPGQRMKAGKAHEVPLAPWTVAMLKTLARDPGGFLFPGKPGKPLTTAATLKTAQELVPGLTAHGFRSTFRDWTADQTAFPRDVAEAALAHSIKDKTEAAYLRTSMLDKRRKLMEAWEAYCFTAPAPATVATIADARAKKREA